MILCDGAIGGEIDWPGLQPFSAKKFIPRITSRQQLGNMTNAAGCVMAFMVTCDVKVPLGVTIWAFAVCMCRLLQLVTFFGFDVNDLLITALQADVSVSAATSRPSMERSASEVVFFLIWGLSGHCTTAGSCYW